MRRAGDEEEDFLIIIQVDVFYLCALSTEVKTGPLFTGAAEERGQAETRLPKCLHLFYRCCYIGLLQIK